MSRKKSPLFELTRPLGRNAFTKYRADLCRVQGNLLKGHGRDAELHVFLTFKPRKQPEARGFLRQFSKVVTSAAGQRFQALQFRRSGKTELFATVCLSAKGYKYLGLPITGFKPEFRYGMARAADRLADPPLSRWEPKFQKDIHAMILFAHDDVSELSWRLSLLRVRVADFAETSSEFGMMIYDEAGRGIEHFGFVDGRSQPLFFSKDVKQDSQLARGRRQWDASAGPSLILIKDPLGKSTKDCGSYYVFRKLEQNVKAFWRLAERLADVLHLTGTDRERAGALIIGRYRDGTPVALRDHANTRKLHRASNDFAYPKVDPDGMRCPFFAHTRKTNPRGDFNQTPTKEQRLVRVARRGMPYGDPTPPDSDMERLPEFGVGLLFQCCQSDLAHQFEFLQRSWANNKNMAHAGVGVDPVIGQSDIFPRLKFPTKWGKPDAGSTPFQFHGLVALKGGEYFFVPSVTFLKNLQ